MSEETQNHSPGSENSSAAHAPHDPAPPSRVNDGASAKYAKTAHYQKLLNWLRSVLEEDEFGLGSIRTDEIAAAFERMRPNVQIHDCRHDFQRFVAKAIRELWPDAIPSNRLVCPTTKRRVRGWKGLVLRQNIAAPADTSSSSGTPTITPAPMDNNGRVA